MSTHPYPVHCSPDPTWGHVLFLPIRHVAVSFLMAGRSPGHSLPPELFRETFAVETEVWRRVVSEFA